MERRLPANPVLANEILLGQQYEDVREAMTAKGRLARARRRVAIGPHITVTFENHETVLHQLQEILRAEGQASVDHLDHELEVYNQMVAPEGMLSATLFIEWRNLNTIRKELVRLKGIENQTYLSFPDQSKTYAWFDPYTQDAFQLSAVQYLLFELSDDQRQMFRDEAHPIVLQIDHEHYGHTATIPKTLVGELAAEL